MTHDICMRPWEFAVEPFRIIDKLYYVGSRNVSSHLIDTGEGLMLIDTGFPQTVYLLLESIRRLGFDPDDIEYIVHCHGHYDHFGGTRAIVELTGAKTCLGEGDLEILDDRLELSWAPEYGVEFYEVFDVDVPLNGGDVVSLGNVSIECMSIPGHTPGAMAFFFEMTEKGEKYTVGMHGGPGLNTLQDAYMEKNSLPKSRREDYMKSLMRLKERTVDITLGAHPGQSNTFGKRDGMTEERNPFIDREFWPKLLERLEVGARKNFGLG